MARAPLPNDPRVPSPSRGPSPRSTHSRPGLIKNALRLAWLGSTRGSRGKRFRSLKTTSILLSISALGSVALAIAVGAGDVSDLLALRLLAYAAVAYALFGLPALLHPDVVDDSAERLAALRGSADEIQRLRWLGLSLRLLFGMSVAALPGTIVAALTSTSLTTLLSRLALVGFATFYLAALAVCLGAIGSFSERLFKQKARQVALLLVLGPSLLGLMFDRVPSLLGAFSWGFGLLTTWGKLSA